MKKEKIINDTIDESVEVEIQETVDFDNSSEPTVIHLGTGDSDRARRDPDDDDSSFERSTLRKRPKDDTLSKFAAISLVLGILSCSICLGNVPLAVIGILLGLTAEANKYKTGYTKTGLVLCSIGCVFGLIFVIAFVLLIIALIVALLGVITLLVLTLASIAAAIMLA